MSEEQKPKQPPTPDSTPPAGQRPSPPSPGQFQSPPPPSQTPFAPLSDPMPQTPPPRAQQPPAQQPPSQQPPSSPYGPPPGTPMPPPSQFSPPPSSGRQMPQIDLGNVQDMARQTLDRIGIDLNIAIKVLIVAVVSGILAGLLDVILGVPNDVLAFTFGWIIVALNGPTYAFFKGKDDLAGLVMSAISGMLVYMIWFLVAEIIGDDKLSTSDSSTRIGFQFWFNQLTIFKVAFAGILVGMLSFGWYAGLRRLPQKFLP